MELQLELVLHHYEALSWLMVAAGLLALLLLMSGISAPYGRYTRRGWGFLINAKVAWMTQELPSFLIPAAVCSSAGVSSYSGHWGSPRTFLTAAFLLHYGHRSLLYPLIIHGGKPTPSSVWALAFVFCVWNGVLQGLQLGYLLQPSAPWSAAACCGMLLWLLGWLANLHSDAVLRALRKPGESGYKIPQGGAFTLVSAANYTGEILEWCGYAVAVAGAAASWRAALPALAFALFTFCNLAPRGWQHHVWYHTKFEDYPKGRRAVIPFLW